jgi:hypothetical protein
MRFEEIIPSIMKGKDKLGVETIKVELFKRYDGFAYFIGYKADNSKTLYVAIKIFDNNEESWIWFCPNILHVKGMNVWWESEQEGI